jgi:drug/metabolite transporter (DMT)-like permease
VLLWAGGYTAVKLALLHVEPMTLMVVRYLLVLAVLGALVPAVRPRWPRGRALRHVAVVGLLLQGLYFGLTTLAMKLGVSTAALALILSLQPILVGLLVPRWAGETVGAARWAGLGLGLAGAALVIASRGAVGAEGPAAVLLAVAGLAAITGSTLYEKRFGRPQHWLAAAFVQHLVGLAAALPPALLLETMRVAWTPGFAAVLGYLVLGNSILANTLLLMMIRHGEAARVSALFFLVPAIAAGIAWAVLGEALSPAAWAGTAIAAAGVLLAQRGPAAAR